jgi:hypothetical protein
MFRSMENKAFTKSAGSITNTAESLKDKIKMEEQL